jgi:hypothetical protein
MNIPEKNFGKKTNITGKKLSNCNFVMVTSLFEISKIIENLGIECSHVKLPTPFKLVSEQLFRNCTSEISFVQ